MCTHVYIYIYVYVCVYMYMYEKSAFLHSIYLQFPQLDKKSIKYALLLKSDIFEGIAGKMNMCYSFYLQFPQ